MSLTDADIDRLVELYAKATPGEWRSYIAQKYTHLKSENGHYIMEGGYSGQVRTHADSAYLAAAHNALPELLRIARIGLRTEAAPVGDIVRWNDFKLHVFADFWPKALDGQRVRIVPDAAIDAAKGAV